VTNADMLDADARDLLAELIEGGVEFLVVGAHALAAHGLVRATGDLDVLVRPEPENARRAWAALHRFGAPLAAHGVTADDLATPGTGLSVDVGRDLREQAGGHGLIDHDSGPGTSLLGPLRWRRPSAAMRTP
jgi:hypothetical protein